MLDTHETRLTLGHRMDARGKTFAVLNGRGSVLYRSDDKSEAFCMLINFRRAYLEGRSTYIDALTSGAGRRIATA